MFEGSQSPFQHARSLSCQHVSCPVEEGAGERGDFWGSVQIKAIIRDGAWAVTADGHQLHSQLLQPPQDLSMGAGNCWVLGGVLPLLKVHRREELPAASASSREIKKLQGAQ